jgi:hypothetical protein
MNWTANDYRIVVPLGDLKAAIMKLKMKVRRNWDEACEKAMDMIGIPCAFGNRYYKVASVEMSLSHHLVVEIVRHHGWNCYDDSKVKYWWRQMLRCHR